MKLPIHSGLEILARDDSVEKNKVDAALSSCRDTAEEKSMKPLEFCSPKNTDESLKSNDLNVAKTRDKSIHPDSELSPACTIEPIAKIQVNTQNEEIATIVQAEKSNVTVNDFRSASSEMIDSNTSSLVDTVTNITGPISFTAGDNSNEDSPIEKSKKAPDKQEHNQSSSEVTKIVSGTTKNLDKVSKNDRIDFSSSFAYGDLPVYQSTFNYRLEDKIAISRPTTPSRPIVVGNKQVTNQAEKIGVENIEFDTNQTDFYKANSTARDLASPRGLGDPDSKAGTSSGNNGLTDFPLFKISALCIGQSSSIEPISPKRSPTQEIYACELEADRNVNLKTAKSAAKLTGVSPQKEAIEILVNEDDLPHSPLSDRQEFQVEYRHPMPAQSAEENKTGKPPIMNPSHAHEDEKLSVNVCEDRGDNENTEKTQLQESAQAQLEGSTRRTRSGTRFSDDTNMLKEFLNREKAKKAAKKLQGPVYTPAPMISPRRSPRKVLAEVDSNSPSPQKPRDLANRPGTPPGKQNLEAVDLDDLDELAEESALCRRSTRKRLFTPAKSISGVPSFIPVRRADGADPIVLQKSLAQELAIVTRANTRRNKGQSKPPKVTLQTLSAEASEDAIVAVTSYPNSKSVGWDETLVYYRNASDSKEGKQEKQPKVRRLRNLGAANGTPAPKKLMTDSSNSRGASSAREGNKSR